MLASLRTVFKSQVVRPVRASRESAGLFRCVRISWRRFTMIVALSERGPAQLLINIDVQARLTHSVPKVR